MQLSSLSTLKIVDWFCIPCNCLLFLLLYPVSISLLTIRRLPTYYGSWPLHIHFVTPMTCSLSISVDKRGISIYTPGKKLERYVPSSQRLLYIFCLGRHQVFETDVCFLQQTSPINHKQTLSLGSKLFTAKSLNLPRSFSMNQSRDFMKDLYSSGR